MPKSGALSLYELLKGVNRRHALAMLTLILVAIPIAFLNEVNSIAALVLARGPDFLSVFDKPQREALARLFLNLRGGGFDVAGIFWGLWLFPLGLLSYRSGSIPKFLGVLLMIGCFAYLTTVLHPWPCHSTRTSSPHGYRRFRQWSCCSCFGY